MNSEIENFFNEANLNIQKLFEIIPIGAIFFNARWEIISINAETKSLLGISNLPNNVNIFSDNYLSEILPLNQIFKMKDGLKFDEKFVIQNEGAINREITISGIPLFEENKFKGGILFLNKFGNKSDIVSNFTDQYSITNLLTQISTCYTITNLEGKILITSDTDDSKCHFNKIMVGKKIEEIFNAEQNTLIQENIKKANLENKNQLFRLKYFTDVDSIDLNTVLIPLNNDEGKIISLLFLFKEKDRLMNDATEFFK
ncbi:MAG: hypothetical protein H6613_09895 [Ignavibacteriales bacterium]|nr:hypothetical protein [Ignavibacteriales bacterium]